jgi:type II secretory pathway pseudopilin PulG
MKKINTRNASGLVEALIVMAIIGTTLVSSMLLVAQGFVEVKNNQTEDTINGVLVQTLNRLKNSSTYTIALSEYNTLVTTTERHFYLRPDNELKLDSTQSPTTAITTCPSNSVYNIIAAGAITTSLTQPLCIQVTIRRLVAGTHEKFSGSINYVYQINEEVVISKLNFVKYNRFNVPGLAAFGAESGSKMALSDLSLNI